MNEFENILNETSKVKENEMNQERQSYMNYGIDDALFDGLTTVEKHMGADGRSIQTGDTVSFQTSGGPGIGKVLGLFIDPNENNLSMALLQFKQDEYISSDLFEVLADNVQKTS